MPDESRISTFAFGSVSLNVIFPLAVTGQLVVNLCFAFKADTHIGLIAIFRRVIREIVQAVYFPVKVQFVAVFVINFSGVCCASSQQSGMTSANTFLFIFLSLKT